MIHQEDYFPGVRYAKIYYQVWLPEGKPRAILLIIHGLGEHCGRYMNVVNHFVPKGFAVYGLDHIGHGKSDGRRVLLKRFEDYTETLWMYFDKIRESQPDTPVFLVGHSLGGLIASVYLFDHQAELAGAILSGPLTKVPVGTSAGLIFMGKILSSLLPRVGIMQLDAQGVSKDPAVVKAYLDDPLVYNGKITARLAAEMLKAMQRVTAEVGKIELPLLLLQGSDDRLVDPDGAQMLYDTVSSTDKTLKIYPGLHHEVYNEPEREEVFKDVEAWLEKRLP